MRNHGQRSRFLPQLRRRSGARATVDQHQGVSDQFGDGPSGGDDHLSETGCQVARSARLVEGSFITLVMPGLSAIGAQVMWGSASSIGLRFERPLHSSVVEHVARTAR